MESYKPKESPEWIQTEAACLVDLIRGGAKLHIQIVSTTASNLGYKYRVRLVYWDGQEVKDQNLSYFLGALWGERVYPKWEGDTLRGQGIGTDRYFLAAYDIGQSLKSLGLIEDPYEIASRKVYREV